MTYRPHRQGFMPKFTGPLSTEEITEPDPRHLKQFSFLNNIIVIDLSDYYLDHHSQRVTISCCIHTHQYDLDIMNDDIASMIHKNCNAVEHCQAGITAATQPPSSLNIYVRISQQYLNENSHTIDSFKIKLSDGAYITGKIGTPADDLTIEGLQKTPSIRCTLL